MRVIEVLVARSGDVVVVAQASFCCRSSLVEGNTSKRRRLRCDGQRAHCVVIATVVAAGASRRTEGQSSSGDGEKVWKGPGHRFIGSGGEMGVREAFTSVNGIKAIKARYSTISRA